jgi:hypothetical protein
MILAYMTWNIWKQFLPYEALISFGCVNCIGWHVKWPGSVHLKVMRNCFKTVSSSHQPLMFWYWCNCGLFRLWANVPDVCCCCSGWWVWWLYVEVACEIKMAVLSTIYLKLWLEFTNSVISLWWKNLLKKKLTRVGVHWYLKCFLVIWYQSLLLAFIYFLHKMDYFYHR